MSIELRHLSAFSALGKELHFGRAADALNIAQPALSKIIQQLEQEIGTPLLIRTTRRVELTEAGKVFLTETGGLETQLRKAVDSARHAARGVRGELKIAYTDFAINGKLPHVLRDFAGLHPDIRLDLVFMPTTAQQTSLLQQKIDIGFMIGQFQHPMMRQFTFDEDDFVALLPSSHPLCAYETLKLEQLSGEDFVMGATENWAAFRSIMFAQCRSHGFFPNIVMEASNTEGIMGLIVAGVGVTIYSSCVANMPRAGVEVRPISNISSRLPVTTVWDRSNKSKVLVTFLNFLRRPERVAAQE